MDPTPATNTWSVSRQRALFMLGLILAGEAVYALPYHVARFFRSSVLEVFDITATQLGVAQGMLGVIAMLSYVPGGLIADRYPARNLLAVSLWMTALGGFYMMTFPGYLGSLAIWSFFALSSVLLFWAALIRATRDWGGADEQGRAYGLLDGGRGLFAAGLASVLIVILGLVFPDGYDGAEAQRRALGLVIFSYTVVTALTGVLVWLVVPVINPGTIDEKIRSGQSMFRHVVDVLRIPAVWLQALVIICAYVAYKGFDNYQLFFVDGYGLDDSDATAIVTLGSWMRPIAALGAGLLADRFNVSRMLLLSFALLLASDLYFAFATPSIGVATSSALIANTLIAGTAIFALRGLYFAVFEEARVPVALTGTAVGVVSLIGYTPDIFTAVVAGLFIDASPGLAGHQHFFMFLSVFAFLGTLTSLKLMRLLHPRETAPR